MDISSNELTRPFRIPRINRHDEKEEPVKRRPPPCKYSGDDGRQKSAFDGGACRSPLVASSKSRPTQDRTPSSYGQRIVPVKRKATSSSEMQDERRLKGNPMDDIMQHMIVPATKQTTDALSDAGSARSLPRVAPSNESGLTRERLERHAARQECHSFAEKGLMEALLEQKMKTGRIEAHTHMGYVRKTAQDQQVAPVEEVEDRTPVEPEPEPLSPPRRGPRTPPGSPPLRRRRKAKGPATPSDSPPAPSSSDSHSASFRGRSDESVVGCSPSPSDVVEPVAKRHRSSKKKEKRTKRSEAVVDVKDGVPTTSSDRGGLMEQIAIMASVPVAQLRKCLDADFLNALKDVDQTMLLATVKTVLSTIAKSKPPPPSQHKSEPVTAEVSSSMSPTPRNVDRCAADNSVGHVLNESNDETVEMELESDEEEQEPVPPPPLPPTCNELGLPPPDPAAPPPPLPPPAPPFDHRSQPTSMHHPVMGQQPNQVHIIQTLLQALAIPNSLQQQQNHASFVVSSPPPPPMAAPVFNDVRQYSMPPQPPPMCRPPRPLSPYSAYQAAAASEAAMRRPPGGQIVNDRSDSPVLLDRYGMPLPIPNRMRGDNLPPPAFPPDHRPFNSNNFGGFPPSAPSLGAQPPPPMPPPMYPEYAPPPMMDRRPHGFYPPPPGPVHPRPPGYFQRPPPPSNRGRYQHQHRGPHGGW